MDARTTQLVRERAALRCEYCHRIQISGVLPFHVEHIRARQHGGGDDLDNLALACPDCNFQKGPNLSAIDPVTGDVVRLFDPRGQSWDENFQEVEFEVHGRTAVGRATAGLLQFNLPHRVVLRQLATRSQRIP
jgi:hypothetical protein